MRILLDLDDTTVDMCGPFTALYNKLYGDNLDVNYLFKDWNMHERVKCGENIYGMFHLPGFFYYLKAKDGAIDGIRTMMNFFDVNIVTSISNSPEAAFDKVRWVRDKLPFYDISDMFMAKQKQLINADIMIDDSAENLTKFNGIKIKFNAPHNLNATFDYNVSTWDELMPVLEKIYHDDTRSKS